MSAKRSTLIATVPITTTVSIWLPCFFIWKSISIRSWSPFRRRTTSSRSAEKGIDKEEQEKLLEKIKEAETKEVQRQEEQYQKQLLQEYVVSSQMLAASPFFRPQEKQEVDRAEFALIFSILNLEGESKGIVEIQLALRLPSRSKPLHIPHVKYFYRIPAV